MNKSQNEELRGYFPTKQANIIKGTLLTNQKPRTLIYGYDTDRNTFHVYLKESIIHVILYRDIVISSDTENTIETNKAYVPSKRVYPESCDYEFCILLKKQFIDIPWTTFNEERENKVKHLDFHGYVLEELKYEKSNT